MDDGRAGRAAWRRRKRWLRAWHRHVKLTVATQLATALHHSAQRPRPVVEVPSEGWRGELYDVPRHQKPPPSGTRPAALREPVPQWGAVTVGYVAAPALLAAPVLAGGDGLDALDAFPSSVGRAVLEQEEEEKWVMKGGEGRRRGLRRRWRRSGSSWSMNAPAGRTSETPRPLAALLDPFERLIIVPSWRKRKKKKKEEEDDEVGQVDL